MDYVSPSNYTAVNTYDALNRRVRIDQIGASSEEFIFNPAGLWQMAESMVGGTSDPAER